MWSEVKTATKIWEILAKHRAHLNGLRVNPEDIETEAESKPEYNPIETGEDEAIDLH